MLLISWSQLLKDESHDEPLAATLQLTYYFHLDFVIVDLYVVVDPIATQFVFSTSYRSQLPRRPDWGWR